MKYLAIILLTLVFSCNAPQKPATVGTFEYPEPVDTRSKEISYQETKTYTVENVSATNNFPAARLNNFTKLDDSTFLANIEPENAPINESPWYAFKIWSTKKQTINVKLQYARHENHRHRYYPKLSRDGEQWEAIDSSLVYLDEDRIDATIQLEVGQDTLWVAAQEIEDTKRVGDWVNSFSNNELVTIGSAGKSALGRPLFFMNISKGDHTGKPAIIIISRQHPPEVTGYFAMQSFVETIIKEGVENDFLDQYRVLVYPLLNPDGVDLGHYRHNTGGVDLNRDWSVYNQTEIAQITSHMVRETYANKNEVLLGLDFHSTYHDVYYTPDETVKRKIPTFTQEWLESIRISLGLETINEQAEPIGRPTSGGWFNKQFGATGITYEIGDGTPRDFISQKGAVSARAMMDFFLK